MPNPGAEIGFLLYYAARFLAWLGNVSLTGPVNAVQGAITLDAMMQLIETVTGMQAQILKQTVDEDMSPFGVEQSWTMDTSKQSRQGTRLKH